jgi:predicted ester cyclase
VDTALDVVERVARQDPSALDELVAENLVNHAAGLQGREGLKAISASIAHDLGETTVETHHLFAHRDLVTHHMSLHGVHRASTMPLLQGVEPTGQAVTWTFVHIWRVKDGKLVEHWACRDDLGLLHQLAAWP